MICAVWIAILLSVIYGGLLWQQIKFVRNARQTAKSAGKRIQENWGGDVIVVLSYLSMFSLLINIVLILTAKQRAIVVVQSATVGE